MGCGGFRHTSTENQHHDTYGRKEDYPFLQERLRCDLPEINPRAQGRSLFAKPVFWSSEVVLISRSSHTRAGALGVHRRGQVSPA